LINFSNKVISFTGVMDYPTWNPVNGTVQQFLSPNIRCAQTLQLKKQLQNMLF